MPTCDVIKEKKNNFISPQGGARGLNYHHSTQDRKLHQAVVAVLYRKKHPKQFLSYKFNLYDITQLGH